MTQRKRQAPDAPPHACLTLRLLGPVQVALGGQPLALPYEKLLALLAFLAVEGGRAHRREVLAELLWPEHEPAAARHNLSQALFHLRRVGGCDTSPPLLLTTRDTVRLNPAAATWVDVTAFQTLADEADGAVEPLEAAVALYGGSFAEGLSVRASSDFEAWVAQTGERLRRQACALLQRLSDPQASLLDAPQMCSYASRWVEIDPLDEAAHRRLMRALASVGQRTAALLQFEHCRRLLQDELGVEPEPETVALHEALRKPEPTPPVATGRAPRQGLARPPGSLIGRDDDLAALDAALADPAARVVSIVGPGGVGKTRLALHLAADHAELFADGACNVQLAALTAPAQIAPAIAQALGLPLDERRPIDVQVQRALASRHMLLLLDNCEHLLPDLSIVLAGLLDAAPHLRILATSRAPLNLSYEHHQQLAPLALPQEDAPAEAQLTTAAAALFVERARAVRPGMALDPAVIGAICRALDGLPLALELAATRTRLLAPVELLARLERRLPLLNGGSHDLPARQQTLTATIDWSYQLLDPLQQTLFRRLAVFAGGWTVSAAEAVCTDLRAPDAGTAPILDGLDALLNASLIITVQSESGDPRFTLLETIAEFAREQLAAHGELDAARELHARAVAASAAQARVGLDGPDQRLWLQRVDQERDNVRTALAWCAERAAGLGLVLAADLQRHFLLRGQRREGRDWLERLLAQDTPAHQVQPTREARVSGLLASGTLLSFLGELDLANERVAECEALCTAPGQEHQLATALNVRGIIAMQRRSYPEAEQLYRASLALRRALNQHAGIAVCLANLGAIVMMQGNREDAHGYYVESLALFRQVGDPANIALVLARMATLLLEQGAYAQAEQLYEESRSIAVDLGNKPGVWQALHGLGTLAREQERYVVACEYFRASSAISLEILYHSGVALDLLELARTTWAMGDAQRTVVLLAAVAAIADSRQIAFHPSDQAARGAILGAVQEAVAPHAFAAAWAYGQALSLEQAVTVAQSPP